MENPLHFLAILLLVSVHKAKADFDEDSDIVYGLVIAFLALCIVILVIIISIPLYVKHWKKEGKYVSQSYRLDHKYDGSYDVSPYGNIATSQDNIHLPEYPTVRVRKDDRNDEYNGPKVTNEGTDTTNGTKATDQGTATANTNASYENPAYDREVAL